MVIVKMKVNKDLTEQHWKELARGVEDPNGNPFRLIKLRWNRNRYHIMAEYTKTRGFEDAVIGRSARTGDIDISYRRSGSIMWQRPVGGIGPFTGELPATPYNIQKLASMYGDKLWTIMDTDIDQQVKKMYELMLEKMTPEWRAQNEKRIKALHSMSFDSDVTNAAPAAPEIEADRLSVVEQKRLAQIERENLAKREQALDVREQEINDRMGDMIEAGAAPVVYSAESLSNDKTKLIDLRRICKEMGVEYVETDKKKDLAAKIIAKQEVNQAAVKEQLATIGADLQD
jgi:hypothetical protein